MRPGPEALSAYAVPRAPRAVTGAFYPIYDPLPQFYRQFSHYITPDGVHTRVVFEGAGHRADDAPLTYEWSERSGGAWRVFAQTRWATNVFDEPGRHEVRLRVADGQRADTDTLEIEILTPLDILIRLAVYVEGRPDQEAGAAVVLDFLAQAAAQVGQGDYPGAAETVGLAYLVFEEDPVLADDQANSRLWYMVQTLF